MISLLIGSFHGAMQLPDALVRRFSMGLPAHPDPRKRPCAGRLDGGFPDQASGDKQGRPLRSDENPPERLCETRLSPWQAPGINILKGVVFLAFCLSHAWIALAIGLIYLLPLPNSAFMKSLSYMHRP